MSFILKIISETSFSYLNDNEENQRRPIVLEIRFSSEIGDFVLIPNETEYGRT